MVPSLENPRGDTQKYASRGVRAMSTPGVVCDGVSFGVLSGAVASGAAVLVGSGRVAAAALLDGLDSMSGFTHHQNLLNCTVTDYLNNTLLVLVWSISVFVAWGQDSPDADGTAFPADHHPHRVSPPCSDNSRGHAVIVAADEDRSASVDVGAG